MLPWEFRALTSEQKGELLASYQVGKEIEFYYTEENLKDMDADNKGRSSGNRTVKPKGR